MVMRFMSNVDLPRQPTDLGLATTNFLYDFGNSGTLSRASKGSFPIHTWFSEDQNGRTYLQNDFVPPPTLWMPSMTLSLVFGVKWSNQIEQILYITCCQSTVEMVGKNQWTTIFYGDHPPSSYQKTHWTIEKQKCFKLLKLASSIFDIKCLHSFSKKNTVIIIDPLVILYNHGK